MRTYGKGGGGRGIRSETPCSVEGRDVRGEQNGPERTQIGPKIGPRTESPTTIADDCRRWAQEMRKAAVALEEAGAPPRIIEGNREIATTLEKAAEALSGGES